MTGRNISKSCLNSHRKKEISVACVTLSSGNKNIKEFTLKCSLQDPEKKYSSVRMFKCNNCGAMFSSKSDLSNHIKLKSKSCGKHVSRRYDLKKNNKSQNGEKKYLCVVCDAEFLRKQNLINHGKLRETNKCRRCGEYFCRKDILKRHEQKGCQRKKHNQPQRKSVNSALRSNTFTQTTSNRNKPRDPPIEKLMLDNSEDSSGEPNLSDNGNQHGLYQQPPDTLRISSESGFGLGNSGSAFHTQEDNFSRREFPRSCNSSRGHDNCISDEFQTEVKTPYEAANSYKTVSREEPLASSNGEKNQNKTNSDSMEIETDQKPFLLDICKTFFSSYEPRDSPNETSTPDGSKDFSRELNQSDNVNQHGLYQKPPDTLHNSSESSFGLFYSGSSIDSQENNFNRHKVYSNRSRGHDNRISDVIQTEVKTPYEAANSSKTMSRGKPSTSSDGEKNQNETNSMEIETDQQPFLVGVLWDKFVSSARMRNSHRISHSNNRPFQGLLASNTFTPNYRNELCDPSNETLTPDGSEDSSRESNQSDNVNQHGLYHNPPDTFHNWSESGLGMGNSASTFYSQENNGLFEAINFPKTMSRGKSSARSDGKKNQNETNFDSMKRKTNQESFPCDFCDKDFFSASRLTSHMISHSDDRPYQCVWCDKTFKRNSHYNEHLRKVHP